MINFILGIMTGMIGLFVILLIVDRCMGKNVWFTPLELLCEFVRDVLSGVLVFGGEIIGRIKKRFEEPEEAFTEVDGEVYSPVKWRSGNDIAYCTIDTNSLDLVFNDDVDMVFIDEMVEYCEGR